MDGMSPNKIGMVSHYLPCNANKCIARHVACVLKSKTKMLEVLEYSYLYGIVELFSPFFIPFIVWCDNMNGSRCHM
jgi:hypothetical protein